VHGSRRKGCEVTRLGYERAGSGGKSRKSEVGGCTTGTGDRERVIGCSDLEYVISQCRHR